MNASITNIGDRNVGPDQGPSGRDAQPYGCDPLSYAARALLDTYEYNSLLGVLDRELSDSEKHHFRDVRALLRHAAARFNLNFEKAAKTIQEAVRNEALSDWVAESYGRTARHEAFSFQRLRELFWTAHIFLERGDSGNFVVRTAMLLETTRRQLVYLLTGLKATKPLISPDQLAWDLNQTLEAAGMYEKNDDWSNTKRFLKTCAEWGRQQLSDRAAAEAAASARNCMGDLQLVEELRNDFIHQARGISESDIENHWGSVRELKALLTGLLEKMKELHGELGERAEPMTNVYTDLNRTVFGLLRPANRVR